MGLKQRIRRDARLVAGDAEAAALLECLVQHLFDPALDLHFLGKVSGATREVRKRLAAAVGPLKGYITELRMIEAARLARETDLPIPEVAKRVGYTVVRTFRRAFNESHQLKPSEMRNQARAAQAEVPDPVAAAVSALEDREIEDAVNGSEVKHPQRLTPQAIAARLRARAPLALLDPEHGAKLRSRLWRRHPALEAAARATRAEAKATPPEPMAVVLLTHTDPRLETLAAGAVFARIVGLPEADLRHAMLDGVRLATSTAFDVLKQFCYGQVRWDAERAVTVATLGVQLLEIHRELIGEDADDWIARAWAFLARVQMMAGDFSAADRTLRFAWEEVAEGAPRKAGRGEAGATMAPWAEIEVRRVEGTIHWRQARGEEAARAFDRAVELGRGLDRGNPERISSVAERLELASFLGDPISALPLCDELEELTQESPPEAGPIALWRGLVDFHRGRAYATAGRDDLAEACLLRAARTIAADPDIATVFELGMLGCFVLHELARLEGRGGRLDQYDMFLRGVLDRYQRLRAPVLQATAEAELAVLCALRGQAEEARRLASSAADFFDHLPGHRQTWNATRLLRGLANGGAEAPEDELKNALAVLCADLDPVRWEISGRQAIPASQARRAGD